MVLINDTRTSTYNATSPDSVAAVKISIFEKNPANGGIPANEKTASVMANESQGLDLCKPL